MKIWGIFRCLLALLLLSSALAEPIRAAESPWWQNDHGAVRLIAAAHSEGDGGELRLGLQFRMKPGWKIYWRSPGDAGYPPQLDWSGSRNFTSADISWPAPERFSVLGLETLGYKDQVVLPVSAHAPDEAAVVAVRVGLRYLTCAEICVPYETTLALDLPVGPAISTAADGLISGYVAQVPTRQRPDSPLRILSASLEPAGSARDGRIRTLFVNVASAAPLKSPDLFAEGASHAVFGAPDISYAVDRKRAVMRLPVHARGQGGLELAVLGAPLTLTLLDGGKAVEHRLAPRVVATAPPPPAPSDTPLWVALVAALIGGFILNLMPCVLPVLSLKLLGAVSYGGGAAGRVRQGFLASAAGILFSFLVLASLAVGLKSVGLAAGWGVQFQHPAFLVMMVALLALFAGNMWGLFEFRLPTTLAGLATRAHGAAPTTPTGDRVDDSPHLGGHFLTGSFATLLATPCSAPFLGTAVGYALSRGAAEIYLVFSALGIGLALPYLVVAFWPALATGLPRPGPWMVRLRQVLGLALIGTAFWLLWVLGIQAGWTVAAGTGLLLALVLLALGIFRRAGRQFVWAGSAIAIAFAIILPLRPPGDTDGQVSGGARQASTLWQTFDAAQIRHEVALGRVVFVDVTADWCITCKVNKARVLDDRKIRAKLAGESVTAMRADWTSPSDIIAAYLRVHGRYGIPFNAVYGPGSPDGEVLPELLTVSRVQAALARAAKVSASKN